MSGAKAVLTAMADYLLPPACAACGGSAGAEVRAGLGPVCGNCRLGLPQVPRPACSRCGAPLGTGEAPSCMECAEWPDRLERADAACLLESPARELVHALKYQGWRDVGRFMGTEMARRAGAAARRTDFVVPVPTSARNIRRRGYNQSAVIASALSTTMDIPRLDCLRRSRQTGTQTALNPMQRRANVSDAFVMVEGLAGMLEGRRLLLVDDVITTGATVLAAAGVLALGSPRSIVAYAFARTVPISQQAT